MNRKKHVEIIEKNENFHFFKISRNINCKMLYRSEFWVLLSVVFGDRQRNNAKRLVCHKMEFFKKQNVEKIEKNENFHCRKFPEISTSKCCRGLVLLSELQLDVCSRDLSGSFS